MTAEEVTAYILKRYRGGGDDEFAAIAKELAAKGYKTRLGKPLTLQGVRGHYYRNARGDKVKLSPEARAEIGAAKAILNTRIPDAAKLSAIQEILEKLSS